LQGTAVCSSLTPPACCSPRPLQEPTGIALAFIIFMAASLVPMTRGAKAEAFGPFTPNAELINGRAAMVGVLDCWLAACAPFL